MRLSNKTCYALRALFDIAYFADGGPATVSDISDRQGAPPRFLEQIFQDLKRADLIRAKRGPQGGYSLARDAASISLGDVVRAVEGPIDFALPEGTPGTTGEACASNGVAMIMMKRLAGEVSAVLDAHSVAELCQIGDDLGLKKPLPGDLMYFI